MKQIDCLWRLDDVPSYKQENPLSKEDRFALHLMKEIKNIVEGHQQFAPSWKPRVKLMVSIQQAVIRLAYYKRRMIEDSPRKEKYVRVIVTYIEKRHAN